MKTQATLRGKLGWFTAMTIFMVGVASVGIIAAQTYFELKFKRKAIAENLIHSTRAQNDLLIPTFILPEQQRGQGLVLERITDEEGLQSAQVISQAAQIPSEFSRCSTGEEASSCLNQKRDALATVTPIQDAGQTFGYLLKIKKLDSAYTEGYPMHTVAIVAIVLLMTFALLFWGMNRITSREVPRELDALVKWLEAVLQQESNEKTPNLRFQELRTLGQRISELIAQYDRARDQAVIGQLTSGIMHDIRTPLQSVVAALELAGEAKDPVEKAEMLQNLYRVSGVKIPLIGEIIETILDGGRDINVEKATSDLNQTIESAISITSELAMRKKADVQLVTPEKPMLVSHDPTQMTRVIANLVKNSLEAFSDVTRKRVIRVSIVANSGNNAVISVEDSGPGIVGSEEKLFRLFRSKKVHGSGLGLLISKKIVEAHGGSIEAKTSGDLRGARFEITIPMGVVEKKAADKNLEEVAVWETPVQNFWQ